MEKDFLFSFFENLLILFVKFVLELLEGIGTLLNVLDEPAGTHLRDFLLTLPENVGENGVPQSEVVGETFFRSDFPRFFQSGSRSRQKNLAILPVASVATENRESSFPDCSVSSRRTIPSGRLGNPQLRIPVS